MLVLVLLSVIPGLAPGVSAAPDTTGYWQQDVAYHITASLDEASGVLTGRVRITYANRSPDTLRDFFVHQYLNAFRPGSRWAAADSAEGRARFQRLADPDYAFERITESTVMGRRLAPDYPYAPDSTIAHWVLPRALAPGDSMTVEISWQARPSTLPRRQGRRGRRFDFAQWYPKVVVYDHLGWQDHPLYPAGEFYGEFGTYDVALDLAADQVIGATGVPIEGDPGWDGARADPRTAIDYQRDWYLRRTGGQANGRSAGAPSDSPPIRLSARCGAAASGRKCVRFFARDVHHFAFSLNPEYIYEQGRYDDVVVRVLYLPGDTATWGRGIAVQRTEAALAWLDTLFGAFAWPQLTNVHRIEGGGTEFPMMVMDGSASLGLIVHEVGHNYTMGILANNEWREGWLDEGFTSFQSSWFFEARGQQPGYADLEGGMLWLDLERWSQPVSMVSDRYRDFQTYGAMIYSKAQLFYEQLRYVVGDETMRRILRTYYARWRLKHVDEQAFRRVAEEVSGQDLGWLFGQWLHGTPLIDYRLNDVERRRLPDGRWRTTVTIERLGDGMMPVEIADREAIYARATGQPEIERIEFTSDREPGRLTLDPRARAHDWNMLNNGEKRGLRGRGMGEVQVDNPVRETQRRDRRVTALMPVAWSNDFGGLTVGLRSRANYQGFLERGLLLATVGLRDDAVDRWGFYFRVTNPIPAYRPRTETSFSGWWVEGRAGAAFRTDHSLRRSLQSRSDPHVGVDAIWMGTTEMGYLDRSLWEDAGTVELEPWWGTTVRRGGTTIRARAGVRGGLVYWYPGQGVVSRDRYDLELFGRLTGEASIRGPAPLGTTAGARVFAGAYLGRSTPPLQRRIMVAGADPYETFTNPLLRSRGALFVRPDFQYHAPGNGNLRAFRPDAGGRWAVGVNLEAARSLRRRGQGVLRDVALAGFLDLGVVDSLAIPTGDAVTTLYDAGLGLVSRQRLGDLDWTLRVEFPFVVSRAEHAADVAAGGDQLAFRCQVSLESSF